MPYLAASRSSSGGNFRGTGHAVSIPSSWLLKPLPSRQKTPPSESQPDPQVEVVKIAGKSSMKNAAKAKSYERMLAALVVEEEGLKREREKAECAGDDAIAAAKEAVRQRHLDIIKVRDDRAQRLADRKAERNSRALRKRREADRMQAAFKAEIRARLDEELSTKTKRSFALVGDLRPDGRLRNKHVREKTFTYFGDSAAVGKLQSDSLKKVWGAYADPDLYFWVPHGYGEWRNTPAEDPFAEGEVVSGTMQGQGTMRFLETGTKLRGTFLNDRPTGLSVLSVTNEDPSTRESKPVSHRLAVYQRGKHICYLDELGGGTRIKLYGMEHREYITDGRLKGNGVRGSSLPVMPPASSPFTLATIVEATPSQGVYRVKADTDPSSLLTVNLKSTLWDLERKHLPRFQGVELLLAGGGVSPSQRNEHLTDSRRFIFDPFTGGGVPKLFSDHRENMFGPSSRVEVLARKRLEEANLRTKVWSEAQAVNKAQADAAAKVAAEKADRKEANRMKKEQQRAAKELQKVALGARADAAAAKADRDARRNAALQASRSGSNEGEGDYGSDDDDDDDDDDDSGTSAGRGTDSDSDSDESPIPIHRRKHYKGKIRRWNPDKPRKPLKPNAGTMLFDDQRWTFLPSMHSLPGPRRVSDGEQGKG